MEVSEAKEVARLWCMVPPNKIDAIKILRRESGMDSTSSKHYLDNHSNGGEHTLVQRLIEDFCQSNEELLRVAEQEYERLGKRIADLKAAIEWEKEEETQQRRNAVNG